MVWSKGVTNVNAKYPYTTVGTPARISKIGFKTLLSLSGAYSDKKIAVINPIGKATIAAIAVTKRVPETKGKTPYERGFNIGVHLVPVKKSQIGISSKKLNA